MVKCPTGGSRASQGDSLISVFIRYLFKIGAAEKHVSALPMPYVKSSHY